MSVTRAVVVQLWSGPRVVRGLRYSTPAEQVAAVAGMTDAQVKANLGRLGVEVPLLVADQRARLAAWPEQADLDTFEELWTPYNAGVRPRARVLQRTHVPEARGVGAAGGTAGSVPRGTPAPAWSGI